MTKQEVKTKKQVINDLVEYYLKQEPQFIARALANAMIDLNRLYAWNSLDEEEQASFIFRLEQNVLELRKFILGNEEKFSLISHECKDD